MTTPARVTSALNQSEAMFDLWATSDPVCTPIAQIALCYDPGYEVETTLHLTRIDLGQDGGHHGEPAVLWMVHAVGSAWDRAPVLHSSEAAARADYDQVIEKPLHDVFTYLVTELPGVLEFSDWYDTEHFDYDHALDVHREADYYAASLAALTGISIPLARQTLAAAMPPARVRDVLSRGGEATLSVMSGLAA